jgi:MFS family permease
MLNVGPGRRDLIVALVGRTVSTFGDGVALIALTLRLQADGAPPWQVALLLGGGGAQLLLVRPIGRLADTYDSRRLLVAGGLTEVAATIPLVFVHSFVLILPLITVLGTATLLTAATWSALIPRMVGEDHLAEAVSAQQSLSVLALVGAPAVGGLLAGAFGTGVPVALDVATYVAVTLAAVLVRTRRAPEQIPDAEGPSRLRSGFVILRADSILAPLLAGVAVVVLLVGMGDVVLVYLVRETLHAGGVWYGVTEASWMAGMVAGSLGAGRVETERGRIRATVGGAALACAGVAGFAVAPAVGILIPFSVLGGVGNGYAGACLSTLLLARTPDSARGRVSAAANAVLGGAQGASLMLGALAAVVLSPRAIYAVAGLLGLSAAVVLAVGGRMAQKKREVVLGPDAAAPRLR